MANEYNIGPKEEEDFVEETKRHYSGGMKNNLTIDETVDVFSIFMKSKMHHKRAQGWMGWRNKQNAVNTLSMLRNAIEKEVQHFSEPDKYPSQEVDIANLAMILYVQLNSE